MVPSGSNMRWLVVVMASMASLILCTSEAFATQNPKSSQQFLGRPLTGWNLPPRGGQSAAATATTAASSSSPTTSPLTCVMQVPPPTTSTKRTLEASGDDANNNNNNVKVEINGAVDVDLYRRVRRAKISRNNHNNNNNKNGYSSSNNSLQNGYSNNGQNNKKNGHHQAVFTTTASTTATTKDNVAVEYVAETKLPTDIGQFQLRAYRVPGAPLGQEPCVIYSRDKPPFGTNGGDGQAAKHVPVRIHDQCLTSEVFRSQRCDCKEQLQMALRYIQKHGGCIIYLQQEGRGIGLANKVAAYALQDVGMDTVDANLHLGFPEDSREYGVVPGILADMNIDGIQLMTNNPRKVDLLQQHGIHVERTLPMVVPQTNPYNRKYMETKQRRMNHDNLATLLANNGGDLVEEEETTTTTTNGKDDPVAATKTRRRNGNNIKNNLMAPKRKSLADQYINNGTEMGANAVQVSLLRDDVLVQQPQQGEQQDQDQEEAGVKAHEDGYCFGRQSVEDAIAAVKHGEMVVVVDDMDRENEGDFIMAADKCTDLDMARIIRYSSGVICIGMEGKRMDELKIPPMVVNNQDPKGTAFGVSVDAAKAHGITTGISASDRAITAQLLADPDSQVDDLVRPGHIFPLRAQEGGVLTRDGHTEASVDLARLAGLNPCGVLCEIVSEENPTEMMRLPELKRFCQRHGFVMTSIVDIAQYRRETGQ